MSDHNGFLNASGCCGGVTALTPLSIQNPPGRSVLSYRVGTQSSFKATMLAAMARQAALAKLTTRKDDDPSIALVDAWATVLDVLTFYQERIANESYLRTATEQRSVLELARAIGYELNPGVAASAYLAFTLDDTEGAPASVTIEVGTKAQNIPGQDELPQTFETVEPIEAHAAWNALAPRLSRPQTLQISNGMLHVVALDGTLMPAAQLYLAGTSTNLKSGDLLLVVLKNDSGGTDALPLRVHTVETDHDASRTRVTFQATAGITATPGPSSPPVFDPGKRTGLFGIGSSAGGQLPLNEETVRTLLLGQLWTEADLGAIAWKYGWKLIDLLIIIQNISRAVPQFDADEGVFALRTKVGFFGNNAPYHGSLLKRDGSHLYTNDWDGPEGWEIWKEYSAEGTIAYYSDADVYLERTIPHLVKDGWAVFELSSPAGSSHTVFGISEVSEASVVGFGLSGKASGLRLRAVAGGVTKEASLTVRKTSAYVHSEPVDLAELPIDDPLNAGDVEITLNSMVSDLSAGRLVMLRGERADAAGVMAAEILVLSSVTHLDGLTTMHFASGPMYSYLRHTVTVNANVARATHGETKSEVLGSGDGSKTFQAFTLQHTPLTYVSAATPSGSHSTLEVRVNNLLWEEVASFFGRTPTEPIYIARRMDDGRVTVQFGDGVTGSRLPTGAENVTATYRVGCGLDGLVDTDQISLLMSRPLGLKSVTNPVPSSGAADDEGLQKARQSAPLTVLTMERIVSLKDFEDFARAFAGIGKAQATLLWNGERQMVHITVAGADGASVDSSSALYQNLHSAVDSARHADQSVQIDSYQPLLFSVDARVLLDERYVAADVMAAVASTLEGTFSFAKRDLGQAVMKSDLLAVMQSVEGVMAVDLDALYLTGEPSALNDLLPARRASWDQGVITPAELLTLHPAGIVLTEMT